MKLSTKFLMLSLCMLVAAGAFADSNKNAIYLVDMQRVLSESVAGKAARADMQNELKKSKTKLDALKAELERMSGEVEKQRTVLSQEGLAAKIDRVKKKERELASSYSEFKAEYEKQNGELVAKLVKEIDAIVKSIADDEGYQFILERDRHYVVYSSEKYDLSARVIEMLDDKKLDL